MNTDDQICGKCKHVSEIDPGGPAEGGKPERPPKYACRRFPPQTHFIVVLRKGGIAAGGQMMPQEEQRSSFPPVHPGWTCGEWTPALAMQS